MRDYILLYINGRRIEVDDDRAFMPLADFLRYEQSMPGTKIVCAEGDCGACTVLRGTPKLGQEADRLSFQPFNSCITPVFLLDCCHVITVEGLEISRDQLDPVQQSFIECNASQCGYCTPGFIMAMAGLFEEKSEPTKKDVQNYLTGNLCRCTGYDSIIQAGLRVDSSKRQRVKERYHCHDIVADLLRHQKIGLSLNTETRSFDAPLNVAGAVKIRTEKKSRLISAATDLGVQINKGRIAPKNFLGLHLIEEVFEISETPETIEVGARITLEELRRFTKKSAPDFSRFLNLFASPQIKNVGTLVGNVANGSPIADSTPYLMMAEATIHVTGSNGSRQIPMLDFYQGYKILNMDPTELISRITIPKPTPRQIIRLYKISARRDLDIACVNAAISMTQHSGRITEMRLAYGGIGPVVKRLPQTEKFLQGKAPTQENFAAAAEMIQKEITPMSDVRGSEKFRHRVARNLLKRFYVDVLQEHGESAK